MEECFLDFIFFRIGSGHLFSGGESNCFFEQLKTRKKIRQCEGFYFLKR